MTGLQIGLLVGGIILGLVLLWVPILVWLKGRLKKLTTELQAELRDANETIRRGPESASYRGASSRYGRVKGNGVIALTERRLIFRKVVGDPVELPVDQLAEVKQERWFLGAANGAYTHLIVRTEDGIEVGFFVKDLDGWVQELRSIVS